MRDFSVPRRDSKTGSSHIGFRHTFDPRITPREAASRRDFTINAMAWDPIAHELLDFFGGREDLENRVLRATSAAFSEDPLRVLRGMQFACRFDLTLDPATAEMSRAIRIEYSTLAKERVAEEFMKWATKATHPGRMAEYLIANWVDGALSGNRTNAGYPAGSRMASGGRRWRSTRCSCSMKRRASPNATLRGRRSRSAAVRGAGARFRQSRYHRTA